MKVCIPLGVSLAVLLAGSALADEPLQSGPQVGKASGGPFNPLNVTGENADEKVCQV
jgi:hypothetical protein